MPDVTGSAGPVKGIDDIPQRTAPQLAESIAELTGRLNELKARKRTFNHDINEEIREVEEILESEHEQWEQLKARQGP